MYFSKGSDLQVFKLLFFHSDAGAKENQISRVKVLWIYMPLEVLQRVVSEREKRLRVSEQALPSSSPGGVTPRERTLDDNACLLAWAFGKCFHTVR